MKLKSELVKIFKKRKKDFAMHNILCEISYWFIDFSRSFFLVACRSLNALCFTNKPIYNCSMQWKYFRKNIYNVLIINLAINTFFRGLLKLFHILFGLFVIDCSTLFSLNVKKSKFKFLFLQTVKLCNQWMMTYNWMI